MMDSESEDKAYSRGWKLWLYRLRSIHLHVTRKELVHNSLGLVRHDRPWLPKPKNRLPDVHRLFKGDLDCLGRVGDAFPPLHFSVERFKCRFIPANLLVRKKRPDPLGHFRFRIEVPKARLCASD